MAFLGCETFRREKRESSHKTWLAYICCTIFLRHRSFLLSFLHRKSVVREARRLFELSQDVSCSSLTFRSLSFCVRWRQLDNDNDVTVNVDDHVSLLLVCIYIIILYHHVLSSSSPPPPYPHHHHKVYFCRLSEAASRFLDEDDEDVTLKRRGSLWLIGREENEREYLSDTSFSLKRERERKSATKISDKSFTLLMKSCCHSRVECQRKEHTLKGKTHQAKPDQTGHSFTDENAR